MEPVVVDVGEAIASGFLHEAVDEATGRPRHKWPVILAVLVLGGVIAVVARQSRRRRAAEYPVDIDYIDPAWDT